MADEPDEPDHLTKEERVQRNKENFLIGIGLLAEARECLEETDAPFGAGGLAEERAPVLIQLGPGLQIDAWRLLGLAPGAERPKDVTPETHAFRMAMEAARSGGEFPRTNWLMHGMRIERKVRDPEWDKLLVALGSGGSSILICAAHQLYHEFSAGPGAAEARAAILSTVPKLKRSIGDARGDAKAEVIALKHAVTQSAARAFDINGYRQTVEALIGLDVSSKGAAMAARLAIPAVEDGARGFEKIAMGSLTFWAIAFAREALKQHLEGDGRRAVAAAMQAAVSIYKPAESLAVLGVMASCYTTIGASA